MIDVPYYIFLLLQLIIQFVQKVYIINISTILIVPICILFIFYDAYNTSTDNMTGSNFKQLHYFCIYRFIFIVFADRVTLVDKKNTVA